MPEGKTSPRMDQRKAFPRRSGYADDFTGLQNRIYPLDNARPPRAEHERHPYG